MLERFFNHTRPPQRPRSPLPKKNPGPAPTPTLTLSPGASQARAGEGEERERSYCGGEIVVFDPETHPIKLSIFPIMTPYGSERIGVPMNGTHSGPFT